MKIYEKKAVTIFTLTLLMASLLFIQVGVAQAGWAFIDPSVVETIVCQEFTVTVVVDVTMQIQWFEFWLYFDSTQMSYVSHLVLPPWIETYRYVAPGVIGLQGIVDPPPHPDSPGIVSLADIMFHCDAPGKSGIYFDEVVVQDYPMGDYWPAIW